MSKELREYMEFKINQLASLTGFDYKQENAQGKLKELVEPKLKVWIAEAIQAGV